MRFLSAMFAFLSVLCLPPAASGETLRRTDVDKRTFGGQISCEVDYRIKINFRCLLTNGSNVNLRSVDGFFLHYQLRTAGGETLQSGKLNLDDIPPDGTATMSGTVIAPTVTGNYTLIFDVHQDWIRTFNINSTYAVEVGREPPQNRALIRSVNTYVPRTLHQAEASVGFTDPGWLVAYDGDGNAGLFPYGMRKSGRAYSRLLVQAQNSGKFGYWSRAIVADLDGNGHEAVILGTYGIIDGIDSRLRVFTLDAGRMRENESIRAMDIAGYVEQILVADFDNDGLLDIFVSSYERLYVLRNAGGGTFVDVSAGSGIDRDAATYPKPEGGEAVDLNFDGKVDIVSGARVFLNVGSFRFVEAGEGLGLPVVFDEGVKIADIDNDGDFDLILVCLTGKDCPGYQVYINEGGTFSPKTFGALARYRGCQSLGVNTIDLNSDGYEDLFFGSNGAPGCKTNMLFLNKDGRDFVHAPAALGSDRYLVNLVKADTNNDLINDAAVRDTQNSLRVHESRGRTKAGGARFKIIVLDDMGNRTKHGAAIRVTTPSGRTFARHVEGGFYVAMNQYPIVINSPELGEYTITSYLDGERQDRLSESGVYLLDRNGLRRVEPAKRAVNKRGKR